MKALYPKSKFFKFKATAADISGATSISVWLSDWSLNCQLVFHSAYNCLDLLDMDFILCLFHQLSSFKWNQNI